MNDFVYMKVVHAGCDLIGPFGDQVRFDLFFFVQQNVGERTLTAELHHHTVARRHGADAEEIDHVLVFQLLQMFDFGLGLFANFLDGNQPILKVALENDTLRTGVDPLQITNGVERNLPAVRFRLALA